MKLREREEMEKMAELRLTIEASPLTKKIREDQAALTLSKRKVAADRIEALTHEAENHATKQTEIDGLLEKLATLDVQRKELQAEINKKYISKRQATLATEQAIQNEKGILLNCYDPKIDETIQFFMAKLDFLRQPSRINKVGRKSETNLISWKKKTLSESNVQAIHSAIEYCRNSITELERMKLLPELDIKKIEKMKTSIPSIDIYTEYTGTAPMARQAPTVIAPCEYTLGKLLEKVNKHLKTPAKKARI